MTASLAFRIACYNECVDRTDADEELVGGLVDVWRSLRDLAGELSADEIDLPTRVPGWSVRDNYSHMIAAQLLLLDRPEELAPVDPVPAYIRNDLGRKNEAPVQARRRRSGADVVEEFCTLSSELGPQVGAMSAAALDAEIPTGHGVILRREMLSMILMDNWVHEQDIRVATGRPGHHAGPAVVHSRDRMLRRIAGRLPAIDGVGDRPVAIGVLAPVARRVVLQDGMVSDDVDQAVAVEFTVDAVVLAALAGGRVAEPSDAAQLGVLDLRGDLELGGIVLANLAFTS